MFSHSALNLLSIYYTHRAIWQYLGYKALNMNLEHEFRSLSNLFDMYSLNMSKVTNSTRFVLTSCIFPKICQNKAKIYNFTCIFWPKLALKHGTKIIIYWIVVSTKFLQFLKVAKENFLKYLCTHKFQLNFIFYRICQNLPQLINYSWAN